MLKVLGINQLNKTTMKKIIYTLMLVMACATTVYADKKKETDEVKRPETESYNYKRAMEAFGDDNLDEAITYFSMEIEEHKKNGYALAMRAGVRQQKGEIGEALLDYNKALRFLPAKDKEFVAMTKKSRADIYFEIGDTVKGLADLDSAIELMPRNLLYLEKRANIYYFQSRYDLSDIDYQSIMNINDGYYISYVGLGRNCQAREEYDKAIEYYSKLITLHKDYDSSYSFRAEVYLIKKEWAKAADDIIASLSINNDMKAYYLMLSDEKAFYPVMLAKLKAKLKKDNGDVQWHYNLGSFYEHHHRYHNAIECYKKCYELEELAFYLERLSECYSGMGDFDSALEYINMAQEQDSDDVNLISEKADILYYQGKTKEAIAEMSRFVEMAPDFAGGYYKRGFYEDNANMIDDAIEDYTMSISLDPDHTYSYLGRGDQYVKKGETELAHADFNRIIEVDTIPSTEPLRAYAYLAMGEREKGKEFLDSCLNKFPTDAGLRYDAACFYSRSGDVKEALKYMEETLKMGYRKFAHFDMDDDLDNIRNTKEYKEIIERYKKIANEEMDVKVAQQAYREEVSEVPFDRKSSNTCTVKCSINDLPLSFVFDTGASDVSLSQVEATFMMKNGYLSKDDIIGKQYYSDANGNISEGTEINIRKVNFGGMELTNVRASVVKNQKAPLLLGQSVFKRLGKIEIDNDRKVLKITRRVK